MHWSVRTDPNRHPDESFANKQIVNGGALMVGVLCLLACPILILNDARLLGWLLLPISAIYFSVYGINAMNKPTLAIWVLFLNFNIGNYFYANILGPSLGMEYLFLASILVSQVVFKTLLAKVISGLIIIALVVIGDFDLIFNIPQMALAEQSRFWIRTFTLPSALLIIMSAVVVSFVRFDQQALAMRSAIKMARTDELTGTGNRFSFKQDIIHQLINKTEDCVLVFFDLDGLKNINDKLGHKLGDEFLIDFAKKLKDTFPMERIYRFGGDEFVLWLQTPQDFHPKLQALAEQFSQNASLNSGVSYGLAYGQDAKSIEQMIELADLRMYAQKKESSHLPTPTP